MSKPPTDPTLTEIFGDPVSVYTRAQALEDGDLIDLTDWGKQTHIRHPIAITRAFWALVDVEAMIGPCDKALRSIGQSTRGRAHDLLFITFAAIGTAARRQVKGDTIENPIRESLILILPDNEPGRIGPGREVFTRVKHGTETFKIQNHTIEFQIHVGPGDDGEGVITLMLFGED